MTTHRLSNAYVADLPPMEVRTVTLVVNTGDLADRTLHKLCDSMYQRVHARAGALVSACAAVSSEYGIPILQRRVCVTPLERVAEGFGPEDLVNIARTLDGAAANARLDFIGGYFVRAAHALSTTSRQMIAALPAILSQTERVQTAVEAASSQAGVNLDAIELLGYKVKEAAEATADRNGIGASQLAVMANVPTDGPPVAGACPVEGWGDLTVHVSVSAMGPIQHAVRQRLADNPQAPLSVLTGDIKTATFQATRVAELIGKAIAERIGADFGRIDLSLAPTIRSGQTVSELLQQLGVSNFGAPGTAAALLLVLSAIRAGGAFASAECASEASILLPVLRDSGLVSATEAGSLAVEHLARLSAVGAQGLDLVPVEGSVTGATLSAVMADQLATAVVNGRMTVVRLIPVPGKSAGERVSFGRGLGDGVVLALPSSGDAGLIHRTGRIPPLG
ncbi:MAG TPA: DUF711 family protein [Planctomycetaceae bacterium]|nr:DUF711 family protein [Planctomycetaceae bacterium]